MEKPTEPDYEVFLSFKGSDTRHDIADYLYTSLIDASIRAYRDDEELRVGEEIGLKLLQVIKQSKISIPIFSKNYAASKWCLMELVQMVECKEKWGQKIMPIFYDVAPSEVRNQTGTYGKDIQSHKDKQLYPDETIQDWKATLNKVGKLTGWELKDRGKGKFTKDVVQELLIELKRNYLTVSSLVEMDDEVNKIMEVIGEQTTETMIIGIYGMGGAGKTTLATIVYNKLLADFDSWCFLSNVRDTEIVSMQNRLISNVLRNKYLSITNIDEGVTEIKQRLSCKKVILVIDDVDRKTQLDALVGVGECRFGRGSKVIITTRDKELLKGVDFQLKLTGMDFDHSLKLFSRHAFRRDFPRAEYVSLSKKAVEICSGLPLALKTIGSLLNGEGRKRWEAMLKQLETIPDQEVKSKLNISFEALTTQQQEIFLDVCCFFVGFDVRIVTYMWDSCKFYPVRSLEVLERRSLIEITKGNRLWVHDQLRDLGHDIVREKANLKPEKQSRVWDHKEAIDVLEMEELKCLQWKKNVEAIRLKFDHQFQDFIEKEGSVSLSNLRYLQVDCGGLDENNVQHIPSTNWFQRNPIILPKLRWLSWHNFPIFFKFTACSLKKLVILDLSGSKITNEWEGWNHLKMAENLKVLNLTDCKNLHRTPDFSAHKNLEQLILKGCTELVQVDRSIGEISELPSGNFGSLVELHLSGSNIQELPNSIETMKNLRVLMILNCGLKKLPRAIGTLEKLEEINASGCRYLCGEIPSEIGNLSSLRILKLSDTGISNIPKLPESMTDLYLLDLRLELRYQTPSHPAPSLNWIGRLTKLEYLCLCCDGLVTLPSDFSLLPKLRTLFLLVNNLERLSRLPQNLSYFKIRGYSTSILNLSYLERLSELEVSHCEQLIEIQGLERSTNLQTLRLERLPSLVKLADLTGLNNLWRLWIDDCPKLVEVRGQLESLESLCLVGCESLERLPDPLSFNRIEELDISGCWKLEEIQGLEVSENLNVLSVWDLPLLEKLPDLTNAKELKDLELGRCPRLVEIRGRLKSLETLSIDGCGSLRQFSDPSSFKKLENLEIKECERLEEILESDEYRYLKKVRKPFREFKMRTLKSRR
ncbi:hypothetical protein BT93_E0995 [Corymbia citriodora subsp. variegata]|nr:hypothetical protein BT93_E0995 [Corymbia citriodora subsp. variegata]